VPVGFEAASALDAPLAPVLVRKIGVPSQPELALGAVTDGGQPETLRALPISAEATTTAGQCALSCGGRHG
jgi:putative phosphoribosyl transferase